MPFAPAGVYPPHAAREYEYTVPPRYAAYFPKQMAKAAAASACIPLRDLPIIRTQGPAKYLEDYCVPLALLHFYHPDVWRMHDTLRAPDATNTPGAGPREPPAPGAYGKRGVTSGGSVPSKQSSSAAKAEQAFVRGFFQAAPPPQFQLPLPFSGSPKFPAFSSPDGRGAPPAGIPPPPSVTHPLGHLPQRAPPLLPPDISWAQWPY